MNPAKRIDEITRHFSHVSGNHTVIRGWGNWLENSSVEVTDENIMRVLQATVREVRVLKSKLQNLGVPNNLYEPTCNGLLQAFHTQYLHQSWSSIQSNIVSAHVRANLGWMSWILQKLDEPDIDPQAYEALKEALAEQENLLETTNLPLNLRELLIGQIEELKIALMLYQVSGIQPITDAVIKQSGEMRHAPAELVEEVEKAGPEAKAAVTKALDIIGKAAKVADSGSKVVKFGKDMYELGAAGWHTFGHYLSGPGGS